MLEFLVAIILAVGFFLLGSLLYKSKISSEKGMGLLMVSLGLIGFGIFIIIVQFGVFVLIKKIAGIILVVSGLFITFKVPRAEEDQPPYLHPAIILLGLFLLFLGIYWILF